LARKRYNEIKNIAKYFCPLGCSSWIKKAGTSDSATNAEKRFKYEKENRPEWIFNVK
jgi:hypothetical protein